MDNTLLIVVVVGLVATGGIVLALFRRRGKNDESHVRVGKEWMTIAEYKKRFAAKSK